jgi:hypothetical protein
MISEEAAKPKILRSDHVVSIRESNQGIQVLRPSKQGGYFSADLKN